MTFFRALFSTENLDFCGNAKELYQIFTHSIGRRPSFFNEHPDLFKDLGIKNGVAVVANIDEIETIIVSGTEGEREEIKVGKGKCIDLLYTGDVQF